MRKYNLLLKAFVAIVAMLSGGLPTLAHDFEVDGIYYNFLSESNKTVEVTFGSLEYSGVVVIPSSVSHNDKTYLVTEIRDGAFMNCTSLVSVIIPNSVTKISNFAFFGCSSLTSVAIGNSVSSIGRYAFDGTPWFEDKPDGEVYINNVLYKYKGNIPDNSSISIKQGTVSISPYAFENCSGLISVTIPNTVTAIGDYAFSGTTWFENKPDGEIYLNNILYQYKGDMPDNTSISIKKGTVSISPYAFRDCTGLTSITIPNSVTTIGEYAFAFCSGLTSVTIPNSVTKIGGWAFEGCSKLSSITLSNSLISIGDWAFSFCPLAKVDIPNSVTEIGLGAFEVCTNLSSVIIPNSVTLISVNAFRSCLNLASVTIGNSVSIIGASAFDGCINLTSINIPNSVTEIGNNAFDNNFILQDVNIFDLSAWCKIKFGNIMANPSYVASNMYLNGEEIKDLVIPEDITEIKQYVFAGLDFETVKIHDKVISIGDSAFYFCDRFTDITIPNSVTTIGGGAFEGCNLETVTSYCETPPVCDYNAFYDSYSALLKVPVGTKDAYANAPEWEKFTNIQEIAGVEDVEVDNNAVETSRYDIHGRRLSEPAKGINIVKMSDGSTKKIMIKD